jgi:nucleolar protein 9
MPKEFRKRGKKTKTKKTVDKDEWNPSKDDDRRVQGDRAHLREDLDEELHAGPSWIIPSKISEEVNLEAPFGYLDADVKAYFRTVDVQIRNWQETEADAGEANEDVDPNEGD